MNTDEQPITGSAVSIYGSNDAMDNFPVLKAFQQYVEAEQAKAGKRIMTLCIVFGILLAGVISVFVTLLLIVSSRNQTLSDRLVEYAMKDLEHPQAAIAAPVATKSPTLDDSTIRALTTKLEEMQRKLADSQAQTEKAVTTAVAEARKSFEAASEQKKQPTAEQLEILRLKALLAAEKEKLSVERERQHRAELEEYRRKHYPELYEKKPVKVEKDVKPVGLTANAQKDLLKEVDDILGEDVDAISYFEEEEDVGKKKAKPVAATPSKPVPPKEYSIPVDVRGSSSHWSVPND